MEHTTMLTIVIASEWFDVTCEEHDSQGLNRNLR